MAIARDAISSGGASATSVTVSHTCTGSNLLLLVYVYSEDATDDISATYNSVSMSKLQSNHTTGFGVYEYVFGLLAPSTGAHNIVVTSSGSSSALKDVYGSSYTGVSQSGLPDSAPAWTGGSSKTSLSLAFTTIADNSWLFAGGLGGLGALAAGANTSALSAQQTWTRDFDSNGAQTPAGSHSLNTTSSSAFMSLLGVSFAPVVAAAPNGNFLDFM